MTSARDARLAGVVDIHLPFHWLVLAGFWTLVDRPTEPDRKFPTSSKELRRRKKGLYDWLDSLGRR
jgi:hypothetical protein